MGNCIECPFHAWTFRGEDGKCVSIPYMDKSAKSKLVLLGVLVPVAAVFVIVVFLVLVFASYVV